MENLTQADNEKFINFSNKNKNKLNVVDLFSGCGGLSLGFGMAGYNIKAMIDFDKDSLLTAEKND